jgi:hypothetical protein
MHADGRLLQISQHSALFAILGTTYGGDGGEADRVAVGAADLQHHAGGHEAGADHPDPDRRLALGHVPGDGGVHDDHWFTLSFSCTGDPRGDAAQARIAYQE